ncbi:MAG: DUF6165 family protein [Pseudomonadota bacterium]
MTGTVRVEIAAGELIDKITILEIKAERISDPAKRANVAEELDSLSSARDAALPASEELTRLTANLKAINEELWEIEDAIREYEGMQDFGSEFIRLARAVYKTNDCRAAVKREINLLLGSRLIEEKSYRPY